MRIAQSATLNQISQLVSKFRIGKHKIRGKTFLDVVT